MTIRVVSVAGLHDNTNTPCECVRSLIDDDILLPVLVMTVHGSDTKPLTPPTSPHLTTRFYKNGDTVSHLADPCDATHTSGHHFIRMGGLL